MTDLSGQYLGRYYLAERLGEGGMAVVYKAYDTRLERDVAIKIIRRAAFPPEVLDQVLRRFEREAKSLAKLSHPNIVKVYDYGEHEGSPYLVMEYLPGGTLKKIISKPMPWQDALNLLLPIVRGVAYAHQRGILHRDIKPANILITEDGEPMLSDFGIAKLFEADQTTTLTGVGTAIGTPEYMAPEQWNGITSPLSDQYSLGIVLYEMVTGRKPYMADTPAAILLKQATEPLPSPRKFVTDLPKTLELVLIKALAKNPDDRYEDVNALIGALKKMQASEPVLPSLPPELEPIETSQVMPPEKSLTPTPVEPPSWQNDETVRAVSLGLYETEKNKKEQISDDVEEMIDGRKELGTDTTVIESSRGNRGQKIYSILAVASLALLILTVSILQYATRKPTSPAVAPTFIEPSLPVAAFSPGSLPLVVTGKVEDMTTIYWYDGETLIQILESQKGEKNWDPAIAASGNVYFTSNRDGKAEIYRLINGKTERVTHTPDPYKSWSPVLGQTGNVYFTSNRDGKAEIYRLINGKTERVTHTPDPYESWSPAIGLTGNIYFTSNRSGKDEVYRLIDGKIQQVTDTPGKYESWGPELGLSGNIYFTSNRDGKAEIYRLIDGKIEQVTRTSGMFKSWGAVVIGKNIYFTSNRSGKEQVYMLTPSVAPIADMNIWTKRLKEKYPQS